MQIRHVEKVHFCEKCNSDQPVRLVRIISQSGVSMVYWNCIKGNHAINKPVKYIPHVQIKSAKIDLETLPVASNYSGHEVCAVCGSPYAERHHWAPRHLFQDADSWPQDYLCDKHHKMWHDIVTPNMSKVRYG